jgi:hypothetical protein
MRHEDLDLLLSRAENGFTARVAHSPVGESQCAEFGVLFSDLVLVTIVPGQRASFVCGHSPGGTGRKLLKSVSNPDDYYQLLREQ